MMTKRYANIKEVSEYTSLPVKTLYEWASVGRIPSIKLGRRVLFDLQDIDQILANLGKLDFNKFTQAPKRHNLGTGAGLLSGLSKQAKFGMEQQAGLNQQFGDLLSFGAGKLIDLFKP
jgi:excisionase family DNA binding protein